MRFMIIVKATALSESGAPPDSRMLEEMTRYNEELVKAGILLAADGLAPSSEGARIRFQADGRAQVVDGPFAETKELVAGFWIWQVRSREEALEWARRIPCLEGGEVELRRIQELQDFGDTVLTPTLQQAQQELRSALEAGRSK